MKISFILYVFQVFSKNQYLTSHGIMYVFVDFRKKIFFTYAKTLISYQYLLYQWYVIQVLIMHTTGIEDTGKI